MLLLGILSIALVCATGLAEEELLNTETAVSPSDVDHEATSDNHDILTMIGQVKKFLEKPSIVETMIPSSNVDHNMASDNDDIQAMIGQEICGPLEEYRECGPLCEPKCSEKEVVGCVDKCKKGCFCMHSLLRNEDGSCVFPMECQNKEDFSCPENQQFTMCVQPSTCQTCLNPRGCPTYACNHGCHCKPGYLRDIDGNCIPMEQCPKLSDKSECPVNEEMVSCVKPIWCNSCEVRGNCKLYSHFCQKGCDCKPKHFRNKYGFCVPEENCSGLDPF